MTGGMAQSGSMSFQSIGSIALNAVIDGGLVEGDDVSEDTATLNSTRLQALVDRIEDLAEGDRRIVYIYFPPGDFRLYGVTRCGSNVKIRGSGQREGTRLAPHTAWEANGPIFGGKRNELNQTIPWKGFVLEDLEIDGDYQNTDAFLVRATLTADALFVTSGTDGVDNDGSGPDKILPSMSLDVTAGSIPSTGGRFLFLEYVGDNVGFIRYTGTTGGTPDPDPAKAGNVMGPLTVTGVTYVDQSNSTPLDLLAADNIVFRYYGETTTELVAASACYDLWINRCYLHDSGSQQLQLGGHPYEDPTESGRIAKERVWLTFSEFSRSYNSDSVDIKSSAKVYVIGCEAHGSHDTGLDIRGQMVSVIGGDYSWSHTGVQISCTSEVLPAPSQALGSSVTTATGQTVSVADRYDDNWPLTFTGHLLQTEKVSGTIVKGSPGTATLTGRGLHGTVPVAAPAFSGGRISFLSADVEDLFSDYLYPSMVARSGAFIQGVTANHCDGNGISVSGSGTGASQVHITGVIANFCKNSGVYVRGVRGVTDVTINQVTANECGKNYEFIDVFPFGDISGDESFNGEAGIWVRNCRSVTLSNVITNEGGGAGLRVDDCGNGVHINNLIVRGNDTWGLDGGSASTTTVHWDGRADHAGNRLGAWRLPTGCRKTGSAFGVRGVRFRPGTVIHTANPAREANAEMTMTSGVIYGARLDVVGSLMVHTLSSYATFPQNSSTGSRMAIATANPTTGAGTVLGVTGSGTGSSSLFGTLGQKLNNMSGTGEVWPDLGGEYFLLAFHNGALKPRIAAFLRPLLPRAATWNQLESGILVSQSDIPAVGSSFTLVNTVALTTATPPSSLTSGDETAVVDSTAGLVEGMTISAPGIPLGSSVASITNSTTFELSEPATLTSPSSLTAAATTDTLTTVTCASTAGIAVGQVVSGTGIPVGATVSSITDATHFVLSSAATATNSGLTLLATSVLTGYWDLIPCLTGAVST